MNFSFWIQKSPSEVFRLLLSEDGMETMQSSKWVPGIERVRRLPDGTLFVQDSWGMYHRERVTQIQKDRLLVFRITPNPVARIFIRSIQETWVLRASRGGTQVDRGFDWIPRLWFPERYLRRAIEKHNKDLQDWISSTQRPRRPLYNLLRR